jgi:hypothetical protein
LPLIFTGDLDCPTPVAKGKIKFLVIHIGDQVKIKPLARDLEPPTSRITDLTLRACPIV